MANPVPALQPGSKSFQVGPVSIDVSGDPNVLLDVAGGKPFAKWSTELGKLSAKATTGKDIDIPSAGGTVKFSASGGVNAGFALYTDGSKAVASLELEDELGKGLVLPNPEGDGFCVFRWGYDLSGSAAGTVALGAPMTATFGVDGARSAEYAVVRRFDTKTPAKDVIKGVLECWRAPKSITSVQDLSPETWIVSEVDGSLAVKLSARYGYDFNWIREVAAGPAGGLNGDIGLKLNAAISVALGFNVSGKYALVVSREPDAPEQVRVRIFKLRKKGWSFAMNGGVSVTGVETIAKEGEFENFVQAVFGTHGLQVIEDLHAVQEWTDPSKPLSGKLSALGVDYFMKFVGDVTGKDPHTTFDLARGQLLGLLDQWDKLPTKIAAQIWSLMPQDAELAKVAAIAKQISTLNQDSLHKTLAPLLAQASFFQTPEGKFLDNAAEEGILALSDTKQFAMVKQYAATVASILDGSALQTLLKSLHAQLAQRLGFDQIEKAIKDNDWDSVDQWLKSKLAEVLGPIDSIAALTKARDVIHTLMAKAPVFYDKAVHALNDTYRLTVSATYEKSSSDTALIDASFDLRIADAAQRFREVLDGQFDELIIQQTQGVVLHAAALTHGLSRQQHVDVTLPYYSHSTAEIAESLAKVQPVDGAEGRVLLYELNSRDEVIEKNRRDSTLAVAGFFPTGDVRKFGEPEISCKYSYRFQHAQMKRAELEFQIKPYVDAYFAGHFPDNGDGSFSAWLGDLDKYIDAHSFNGTDNFGDVRLALDVVLPAETSSFWLRLNPKLVNDRIDDMSRGLQAALRRLIFSYHFADPTRYADLGAAPEVLVYASLPLSTAASLDSGNLELDKPSDLYWEYTSPRLLKAMISNDVTTRNLASILRGVSEVVASVPELKGVRSFYNPDATHIFREMALTPTGSAQRNLESLLRTESMVIRAAKKAVDEILEFLASRNSPTKAIKILADFGDEVTSTFNGVTVYTGDAVRPLGPVLLSAMAQAMCPEITQTKTSAMLSVSVLKNDRKLPDLSAPLKSDDVVVEQRLVSM